MIVILKIILGPLINLINKYFPRAAPSKGKITKLTRHKVSRLRGSYLGRGYVTEQEIELEVVITEYKGDKNHPLVGQIAVVMTMGINLDTASVEDEISIHYVRKAVTNPDESNFHIVSL